jgi:hypothetical protein
LGALVSRLSVKQADDPLQSQFLLDLSRGGMQEVGIKAVGQRRYDAVIPTALHGPAAPPAQGCAATPNAACAGCVATDRLTPDYPWFICHKPAHCVGGAPSGSTAGLPWRAIGLAEVDEGKRTPPVSIPSFQRENDQEPEFVELGGHADFQFGVVKSKRGLAPRAVRELLVVSRLDLAEAKSVTEMRLSPRTALL